MLGPHVSSKVGFGGEDPHFAEGLWTAKVGGSRCLSKHGDVGVSLLLASDNTRCQLSICRRKAKLEAGCCLFVLFASVKLMAWPSFINVLGILQVSEDCEPPHH